MLTRRRLSRLAAALVIGAGMILATRFAPGASAPPNPRDVVLIARDMRFYLDGQSNRNPTLRLKAGETIRLVVRNQQPGLTHDFAIPAWRVATGALLGMDADVVTFTVPNQPGRHEYICNPHAAMMRGFIEVE